MHPQLPPYLKSFEEAAHLHLLRDPVKDIEFSGQTYQVLVEEENNRFWVFLQLEENHTIRDGFCSCQPSHLADGCMHLAVAYLYLFHGSDQPLHERFDKSLWNHLCILYEEKFRDNREDLQLSPAQSFDLHSSSGKKVFSIRGNSPKAIKKIKEILQTKKKETEETSLKFSNLSLQEIQSWKEGYPNSTLRYDLSFWSDFAKWWMEKQEAGENYTITFQYSVKNIPNWLQVDFEDISFGFYLSQANLPLILESLSTVKSPFHIYHLENKGIKQITYDKKTHTLHVEAKPETSPPIKMEEFKEVISLKGWIFVPNDGFYALEQHELLSHPEIYWENIPHVLLEHGKLIQSLLKGHSLSLEPISLSYKLHFDKQWNLHIHAFLFEAGDLSNGTSWLCNGWAYLEDQGFYFIEDQKFSEAVTIIPFHKVSDFVSQQRHWLNSQKEFETHIRSIEFEVHYEVNRQNRLVFKRGISKQKKNSITQDFGAWVYLKGMGFYSKQERSFMHLIDSDASLNAEQIPLFIRMNQEELELVPGFFSEKKLIVHSGLSVEFTGKEKLKISPHYEICPEFQDKKLKIFDDIAYAPQAGFYLLPPELRLPEKFREPLELKGEELVTFLEHEMEEIKKYLLKIDPRLVKCSQCDLKIDSITHASDKGRGWYRFHVFYQTERGIISLKELLKEIQKKNLYGFFSAGLVHLNQTKFDWLRYLQKDRFESSTETITLNALEFLRLQAMDTIILEDSPNVDKTLFLKLTQLQSSEEPDFTGLRSKLRNYQLQGARWLWFLYLEKLSGLLCDDMGLGKTHQTMALLAAILNIFKNHAEGTRCSFLIVCPTSVLYHWEEKLQQFLPEIPVHVFYGQERNLEHFEENQSILLTSYGILRNEREKLSSMGFEAAIFDEIQVAKNQRSLTYAALHRINAQIKIGLTGTPIENHLRELKTLFDLVLPGYMPGEKEFRDAFIKPIERENSEAQQKLLRRLITPFTLRRKKEEVLNDLPEKTEEIAHCDLLPEQSALYSEVLTMRRHALLEDLEDQTKAIPFLHIFALLSSLKQICDHPAVYLKKVENYRDYESGKWELFKELIREARESQQKVVVFSQYLHMLDIMEQYCMEENIGFASLRGGTTNRKDQLKRFEEDPTCELFLGSLQAAGLGIDLTAASVVIHYDRWWNAARENQATDRVHRIGQKRGVQVFKLVTKWTFEEKIDKMITKKGKLLEEVVGTNESEGLKVFNRNELIELLHDLDIDRKAIKKPYPLLKDDQ